MYFRSCLIMGCGPLKGKERKNATVAQELLSEERLQQLLKQEELWQMQNKKEIKKIAFWTHLVVAAASWRRSHSSNLMTVSALPHPWFQQALDWVPAAAPPALLLAACLSAGQTAGSQTVCGMPKWCWDFTICLSCSQPENLWGCVTYFSCWRTKSKPSWSQQWKNQLLQFSRLFKGITLQPLGVSIM